MSSMLRCMLCCAVLCRAVVRRRFFQDVEAFRRWAMRYARHAVHVMLRRHVEVVPRDAEAFRGGERDFRGCDGGARTPLGCATPPPAILYNLGFFISLFNTCIKIIYTRII